MDGAACIDNIRKKQIVLQSVHIDGTVDGLFAVMTISQRYRNDSGQNLEIVYTFPLACGATLLSMHVTLGGKRIEGVILEKEKAHEHYEDAIDCGNAPTIVERAAPGLYTVNLGNINDGEEALVEIGYAEPLHIQGGRARLRIPCVIAARYGDPHREGGLAVHETDTTDILAEYPLTLKITLTGHASTADPFCPSHTCDIRETATGKEITLRSGAMLDRDFLLNLGGMAEDSFVSFAPDGDGYMAVARFFPVFSGQASLPLRITILADCSGSMAGEGIETTQKLLFALLGMLQAGDSLAYSRFGSAIHHEIPTTRYSPAMAQKFAKAVTRTKADMGGTELEAALAATLSDSQPEYWAMLPDILLITNGAVWNGQDVLRACKESYQRIFVLGVGSSPVEGLLREVSQTTGGACECVSPNENAAHAMLRMVERMRCPVAKSLRVAHGVYPDWQSPLPRNIFPGDCVDVFAFFAVKPLTPLALQGSMSGGATIACQAEWREPGDESVLIRLGGSARLAGAESQQEVRDLALRYRLVSEQTAMFLLGAQDERQNTAMPVLHQVPQMAAAGNAGLGFARRSSMPEPPPMPQPSAQYCLPPEGGSYVPRQAPETPLEQTFSLADDPAATPLDFLHCFDSLISRYFNGTTAIHVAVKVMNNPGVAGIITEIAKEEKLTALCVWAIFADWLRKRFKSDIVFSHKARRQLRFLAQKGFSDASVQAVVEKLAQRFPDINTDEWGYRQDN